MCDGEVSEVGGGEEVGVMAAAVAYTHKAYAVPRED
jgi:hypothetical protein